jgi:hypothetical protein
LGDNSERTGKEFFPGLFLRFSGAFSANLCCFLNILSGLSLLFDNSERIRAEQRKRSQEQGREKRRGFDRHGKERGGILHPSGLHNATIRVAVESIADSQCKGALMPFAYPRTRWFDCRGRWI